jgi:two-component system chemotaxis response regulator CheB
MSALGRKIRVLIVDDSIIACKILSEMLSLDPGIEVAGTALSGSIALSKLSAIAPDLVMVDSDMPVMDGLQTLAEIKKVRPKLPVIMCTESTEAGNRYTTQALLGGATDFVTKPSAHMNGGGLELFSKDLLKKIKSIFNLKEKPEPAIPGRESAVIKKTGPPEILAIGVSTGGPQALLEVISKLPSGFPAPIVIVQHMPPLFTKSLSKSINDKSAIRVEEGFEGGRLEPGKAWIAPGGSHMQVVKRKGGHELAIISDNPVNSCRPSVDVLFLSVVEAYGSKVLAVVLTGMGQDGLAGADAVHRAGGAVFVQDEASSVVWGMPGSIAKAGLADKIISLRDLPMEIQTVFSRRTPLSRPGERDGQA